MPHRDKFHRSTLAVNLATVPKSLSGTFFIGVLWRIFCPLYLNSSQQQISFVYIGVQSMNVERTREYADAHIPGSSRSKADFRSAPVSSGNERHRRLPHAITESYYFILILYDITACFCFMLSLCHGIQLPDLVHVLLDRTVRRELACAGRIHHSHARPSLVIAISLLNSLLRFRV